MVAAAGFGINLALGVLYSWSIFSKELVGSWGWSSSEASLPYAVAVACFALVLSFGGRAQDRRGPRLVATIGGVLLGAGLMLSSLAAPTRAFPVILGFGVLGGSGIALGFVSTFPPAAKWAPPGRRGAVTGLVVSGFGIASVYIAPLTQFLLGAIGVAATFLALGAAFLVVTVSLAQLLADPPPGYSPARTGAAVAERTCPTPQRDYDWHEMVRTRQFVLLWLMYGLTAFAGIMVIGHMAEITAEQTGRNLGFLLVAVLALGNASGRIVAGVASDRFGTVRTMTVVFGLQTAMMLVVGVAGTVVLLAAIGFAIGFNYGADLSLFPCIVSEYFGQANQGVNYGLVFTSWGVGGVFGSMAAGAIVDATGSYAAAFSLAAALCAVATGLTFLTRPPVAEDAERRTGISRRRPRPSA
jgi:OFA family oxalate/formate antiporter-like MFS transporter